MEDLRSVLLIDDGELEAACAALATLELHIDHIVGEPFARDFEAPYDLIVTNVRRASAAADALGEVGGAEKTPWVAIHDQDFLPLRDRLRRSGVDFLVVASVDPEVLRLLFLHALYRGPEKREVARVPIGAKVTVECGQYSGPARLLDLTLQGCRLSGVEAGVGDELTLRFPSGISTGRQLVLRGPVVRFEAADGAEAGEAELAVAFGELASSARTALVAILAGQALGTRITPLGTEGNKRHEPSPAPAEVAPKAPAPEWSQTESDALPSLFDDESDSFAAEALAAVREATPTEAAPVTEAPPAAQSPVAEPAAALVPGPEAASPAADSESQELLLEDVDRRRGPRALYQREITAQTSGSTLVLLARDLSLEGVRIDAQPGLGAGSVLRLTIFGGPQQRPAVVAARVAQDDGEQGVLLSFGQMAPHVRSCLEAIVGTAPAIEALGQAEGPSHMVVADPADA